MSDIILYLRRHLLLASSAVVVMLLVLNVGYYNVSHESEPDFSVFFWKTSPSFQVRFVHIATEHWGEDPQITDERRQFVIDYCKYRLGIETQLDHPDDIKRCSAP